MNSQKREFLVIRCTECERHFGALSSASNFTCPGCGEIGEHPIVDRAQDDADLSRRVALANVPPELRANLDKQLIGRDNFEDFEDEQPSPRYLLKILSNLVDEEQITELEKLDAELTRLAVETPNAQELIDMAESQGLLMRHPLGGWQWLG